MKKIKEKLEITGDIMVPFKLNVSWYVDERVIPDEEIQEHVREAICETLKEAGLEINDSKIYNFDIYKELEEE